MKSKIPVAIFLLYILGMMMFACMPQPAQTEYPDFTLKGHNGESVSLSSFRGKSIVVLGIGNPYT